MKKRRKTGCLELAWWRDVSWEQDERPGGREESVRERSRTLFFQGKEIQAQKRGIRQTGEAACGAHEGGREKWKDDKEMARHLRRAAILAVPPSLPLSLIITVFSPASLPVSSSRQDVTVAVVKIICACAAYLEETWVSRFPVACRQKTNICQSVFLGGGGEGSASVEMSRQPVGGLHSKQGK